VGSFASLLISQNSSFTNAITRTLFWSATKLFLKKKFSISFLHPQRLCAILPANKEAAATQLESLVNLCLQRVHSYGALIFSANCFLPLPTISLRSQRRG
jgi:hypothetical protein